MVLANTVARARYGKRCHACTAWTASPAHVRLFSRSAAVLVPHTRDAACTEQITTFSTRPLRVRPTPVSTYQRIKTLILHRDGVLTPVPTAAVLRCCLFIRPFLQTRQHYCTCYRVPELVFPFSLTGQPRGAQSVTQDLHSRLAAIIRLVHQSC